MIIVVSALFSCGKVNNDKRVYHPETPVLVDNSLVVDSAATDLLNYIDESETYFAEIPDSSAFFQYKTLSMKNRSTCTANSIYFNEDFSECLSELNSEVKLVLIKSINFEMRKLILKKIVEGSIEKIEVNGDAYRIKSKDGNKYEINKAHPLLANPYSIQTTNGEITFFYGIQKI